MYRLNHKLLAWLTEFPFNLELSRLWEALTFGRHGRVTITLRGGYGEFWPKNQFFFFAKCPSHYSRLIRKIPRSQDFFPALKKKIAFILIPMRRIICTIYHSTIFTGTSFIKLDFILLTHWESYVFMKKKLEILVSESSEQCKTSREIWFLAGVRMCVCVCVCVCPIFNVSNSNNS